MSEVIRWKIGEGKLLKLRWSRGAAFDLSSEGFDGPDGQRFEAFMITFLWACCENRGKLTPRNFADLMPEEDDEKGAKELQEAFLVLLKDSPWKEFAEALEKEMEASTAEETPRLDELPAAEDARMAVGKPADPEPSSATP